MSKRYVLLTDLLEFKKGEVLKEEEDCPNYFNANGHSFYERIPLESIIHCPQHFKEFTDTPPNPTKNVIVGGIEYLSPRDVWEREKKAFEAARKGLKNGDADERSFHGKYYKTFEDYKKANP